MCSEILEMFYQSAVDCSLYFSVVCWGSNIGAGDTNRLTKLERKASSIIGCKQDYPEQVVDRKILKKILSILDNRNQPLHHLLQGQWRTFSNRLLQFCFTRTDTGEHSCLRQYCTINHLWTNPPQI